MDGETSLLDRVPLGVLEGLEASFSALPPPPVSFISAVRKLLTPLHTCKPERVKAFHRFCLPSEGGGGSGVWSGGYFQKHSNMPSPAHPDSSEILIFPFLRHS